MPTKALSRKHFIAGGIGLAIAVIAGKYIPVYLHGKKDVIPGNMVGANSKAGHLLLGFNFPAPSTETKVPTVIVGGGVSGLSAARWLSKNGNDNYVLLELGNDIGGNAAWGKNHVSAYPWGAHYLPVPDVRMKKLLAFLGECESIIGYDKGLPMYNDYHLCAAPEERLFIHGTWQEGLVPHTGISKDDDAQIKRFFIQVNTYRELKCEDGKDVFAIPVHTGSKGKLFEDLDRVTFAAYLKQEGYTSKYLLWYLNYCCRDDYGTTLQNTSAFAGLHYFAARKGKAANADHSDVLTWPEGNGYLVERMRSVLPKQNIRNKCVAYSVRNVDGKIEVLYYDTDTEQSHKLVADKVVMATPQYVNAKLLQYERDVKYSDFTYSPWMIANITVKEMPKSRGVPLAWDNVFYDDSKSLGYVNACQQHLSGMSKPRVLTYYMPLTEGEPRDARMKAYDKDHAHWVDAIMADMKNAHVNVDGLIERIDIWLWGHAMVRPLPGFISGTNRSMAEQNIGDVNFAHSDLSGISIFEEAFYAGIRAADKILGNEHSEL